MQWKCWNPLETFGISRDKGHKFLVLLSCVRKLVVWEELSLVAAVVCQDAVEIERNGCVVCLLSPILIVIF